MNLRRDPRLPRRRTALAAALIVAGCSAHAAQGSASAQALAAAMPAGGARGDGVAALMQTLHAAAVREHVGERPSGAQALVVTSCADDNTSGTLRKTVAAAASGDTIELGALACSTITLTQGAIRALPDNLTLHGPGAGRLAIDGAGADRVFVHYGYGAFTLSGLTVRNGYNRVSGYHVAGGACVLGSGDVVLEHSTVSGCSAIGEGAYGGAILTRNLIMYTSILTGNTAQGSVLKTLTASYGGGAFAYRGRFTLYDSTVSANSAVVSQGSPYGSYDTGGGLFADNGGYVLRSTIATNYTDGTGGGIASHGALQITNSTISGNVARYKAGGGVFQRGRSFFGILNSTLTRNASAAGGGIYMRTTAGVLNLSLESSIVAGNFGGSGADIGSSTTVVLPGSHDLVGSVGPFVPLPPDTLRGDPQLLPLADNGGPTLTHALHTGSIAIDRGSNSAGLVTDQRGPGFPRVLGSAPDIGAFEGSAPGGAPPVPAPTLGAWALAALAALLGGHGTRFFTRHSPHRPHSSQM